MASLKTIEASDLMGGLAMEVALNLHYSRACRVRLWLGTLLIRLAARVIGCGIEIKEE